MKQKGVGPRSLGGNLSQRRDIVEHPEAASMRRDDQIVFVNREIAHRGCRQIELQRLPMIAIIEGNEDGALGAGE